MKSYHKAYLFKGEHMEQRGAVMIVDDDTALLDVLRSGLLSEGYPCEAAGEGTSALELIRKTPFDIMIADIDLPGMNGLDLVKKAKSLRPEMAVIVVTGFIEEFSYDEAIEAGASDFIKKPFTLRELLAKMNQIRIQDELQKREKELKKKVKELEEFYDMAVGRELRMKELKEEMEELREELKKCKKTQ
jgi:DNA-binding NtrC family response regulator